MSEQQQNLTLTSHSLSKRRKGSLDLYSKELASCEPLSKPEELALAVRMQAGDMEAREKLLKANLRFVILFAMRYNNGILPIEDLISIGNMGLLKAAEKFDPSRGIRFITYAEGWMKAAILGALYNERTIPLPRNRVGQLIQILRLKDDSPALNYEELAEELHLEPGLVTELLKLASEPRSLDREAGADIERPTTQLTGVSAADRFSNLYTVTPDEQAPLPEKGALREDFREALQRALLSLPPREKLVLEYLYGLGDKDKLWLGEIALLLGVSKERVRKIGEHALMALRRDHTQELKQYLELEE